MTDSVSVCVMELKSQAGLLYADDVCVIANSEEDMKVIMETVNECVVEYGLKVVCINGEVGRRGFKNMGDRMKETNGLIGMVKYAAE